MKVLSTTLLLLAIFLSATWGYLKFREEPDALFETTVSPTVNAELSTAAWLLPDDYIAYAIEPLDLVVAVPKAWDLQRTPVGTCIVVAASEKDCTGGTAIGEASPGSLADGISVDPQGRVTRYVSTEGSALVGHESMMVRRFESAAPEFEFRTELFVRNSVTATANVGTRLVSSFEVCIPGEGDCFNSGFQAGACGTLDGFITCVSASGLGLQFNSGLLTTEEIEALEAALTDTYQ